MKKIFSCFCLSLCIGTVHTYAQNQAVITYATSNLDNLKPTAVNRNLLPNSNNSKSLGSSAKRWRALYISGNINLANNSVIKLLSDTVFKNDQYRSVFTGAGAGASNTGFTNVGNGYNALHSNTTGGDNVAIGTNTLYSNTTGGANTATGPNALPVNTTGDYNTGIGEQSLYSNTAGTGNTAEGFHSLAGNLTGNYNTAAGFGADVNNDGYTNTTVMGYNAKGTASNQVRIGDYNVTSIGGFSDWTNISDGRVKTNIKQNVPGLAFINKLNPVTYNLDLNMADRLIQPPAIKDKLVQTSRQDASARQAKMQQLYTGFIAQDVEKAAKSLNYNFSGVDAPKNDKDLYGLRYAEFVVPLVKAVQELSQQNDAKDAVIKQQNDKIADIEARLAKLEASTVSGQSFENSRVSSAILEQNIPNPFSNTTTINYFLPDNTTSAKILLTDKNGRRVKEAALSGSGKGSLKVDASVLAGGAYQYSLYVNNRLVDTKQMLRIK